MPWRSSNVEQQRKDFVMRALRKTDSFSSLCSEFGVSRQTGYLWLNRARANPSAHLRELSRRPHHCRNQVTAHVRERVLELHDRLGHGARKIAELLRADGHKISRTTTHEILHRNARVRPAFVNAGAWIARLLSSSNPLPLFGTEDLQIPELPKLVEILRKGTPRNRKKAIAVLARFKRIPIREVADALQCSRRTISRCGKMFASSGCDSLFPVRKSRVPDDQEENKIVFSLLHTPPSAYGFNRTSWKMADIHSVMKSKGHHISERRIRRIIRKAGFRWRKAKVVLTSTDPDYVSKLNSIKEILSELSSDEAFFSIDEYGPFSIKQRGGRKRVLAGAKYVVPQWQKSRGWTILVAALELSTNQVTHFYSLRKNTDEMIKMADILREKYHTYKTIYLSWDAASWHISKQLVSHLENLNLDSDRHNRPVIKTAPLPACAQFLNVIESVFSGMARAIIHNSDYPSLEAAKGAIDQYFAERNNHFRENPKRAGQKIWGAERVLSQFSEEHNCKDPSGR